MWFGVMIFPQLVQWFRGGRCPRRERVWRIEQVVRRRGLGWEGRRERVWFRRRKRVGCGSWSARRERFISESNEAR